ncbi:M20/M25/M40 family metallo-hydrolase [Acuticoccus sp.]|uniref:M20/M25/M40 family metallo-hydrolase n=1 Tax=Acuticoccus sp. TaxID=1904378 RepID=UPI003B51590D
MNLPASLAGAIGEAVKASADEATAFVQALVRFPTENPPGDTAEATEWLATALEGRGLEAERHPVPDPFARHYGRHDVTNLLVRRTFGPGPTIALAAPIDTLPVGSGWQREPFAAEVKDGVLYGRGARDSKADVAAYLFALAALEATGTTAGTVELHLTADEESGGFLGPAFLLSQGLTRPDAVIAAGTSYQVVTGQEGVLHLEVILRGVQAHASRPQDGRDALAAAMPLLGAVFAERQGEGQPITVGLIDGGRGVNVVPDRVRFTVDRRLAAGEDGEAVERAIVARLEAAHRERDVELECRRLLLAEPVEPTASSVALARTISRHAESAFARSVPIASAPVVSGARHYALAGIATALYGVGPPIVGEGVDFTGDEGVRLSDLHVATRVVALSVAELLLR